MHDPSVTREDIDRAADAMAGKAPPPPVDVEATAKDIESRRRRGMTLGAPANVAGCDVERWAGEFRALGKERDARAEQVDGIRQTLDDIIVACGSLGLMPGEVADWIKTERAAREQAEKDRDEWRTIANNVGRAWGVKKRELRTAREQAEGERDVMGTGHRAWCIALDHAGRGMEPEEMGKLAARAEQAEANLADASGDACCGHPRAWGFDVPQSDGTPDSECAGCQLDSITVRAERAEARVQSLQGSYHAIAKAFGTTVDETNDEDLVARILDLKARAERSKRELDLERVKGKLNLEAANRLHTLINVESKRAEKAETERDAAFASVRAITSDLEQAEAALLRYGGHRPGCNWHEANDSAACDCGWAEIRAALEGGGDAR